MPDATTTKGVDPTRLDTFLRHALPGLVGSLRTAPIGEGQSNPTFFVDYDNRRLVLRKKPDGPLLPSAHAVEREFRVMRALASTDLPVPEVVVLCEDDTVLGTPFYVMERVEGRILTDGALPGMTPAERRAIYLAMAGTMAQLHRVDWARAGLSDYGRHGQFFQRQIHRWQRQWQLTQTGPNPAIDTLIDWLSRHYPTDDETALTHGDFRLGNLMFHPTEPRVVAVLDWELSTLGHPLSDVAFNAIWWRTLPSEYGGLRGLDLSALGIPEEQAYLDHYHRVAGRDARVQPFHLGFALMRLAVIFEGIAARAKNGNAVSANAREVGVLACAFARRGLEAVGLPH